MTHEQLTAFIDRLEIYSRQHPVAYKVRLILLAALGYMYLFTVVVAIVVVCGLVVFYVRLNWLVIKVLWLPLAVPIAGARIVGR